MGKSTISMAIFKFANCEIIPEDLFNHLQRQTKGFDSSGLQRLHCIGASKMKHVLFSRQFGVFSLPQSFRKCGSHSSHPKSLGIIAQSTRARTRARYSKLYQLFSWKQITPVSEGAYHWQNSFIIGGFLK